MTIAWDEANTVPSGTASGCILDNTPGCSQLIYANGFASVYKASGFSLPAAVLIVARNPETSSWAVFVGIFVPTSEE